MVLKSMNDMREHDVTAGDVLDLRECVRDEALQLLLAVGISGYTLTGPQGNVWHNLSEPDPCVVWRVSDLEAV